jgi:hypothetical protein
MKVKIAPMEMPTPADQRVRNDAPEMCEPPGKDLASALKQRAAEQKKKHLKDKLHQHCEIIDGFEIRSVEGPGKDRRYYVFHCNLCMQWFSDWLSRGGDLTGYQVAVAHGQLHLEQRRLVRYWKIRGVNWDKDLRKWDAEEFEFNAPWGPTLASGGRWWRRSNKVWKTQGEVSCEERFLFPPDPRGQGRLRNLKCKYCNFRMALNPRLNFKANACRYSSYSAHQRRCAETIEKNQARRKKKKKKKASKKSDVTGGMGTKK